MNLNGQSRSIQLFKELRLRISTDSQVLLVCHKDSEHWYSSQEHDLMNGYRILPKEHFGQSRIFKEGFNYHKSRYPFFKPSTESDADVLLMNMGTTNPLKFIF